MTNTKTLQGDSFLLTHTHLINSPNTSPYAWIKLNQLGSVPPSRAFHSSCAYGDCVIIFGGRVKRYMGTLPGSNANSSTGFSGFVASGVSSIAATRSGQTTQAALDSCNDVICAHVHRTENSETCREYSGQLSCDKTPCPHLVWIRPKTRGQSPIARESHTACICERRWSRTDAYPTPRMVVFGGHRGESLYNDVWTLSLGSNPDEGKDADATKKDGRNHQWSNCADELRGEGRVSEGNIPGGYTLEWQQLRPIGAYICINL